MPTGIGEAQIANAVIESYRDHWCELVFQNNILFDFNSSPYAVGSQIDGPSGLLPIIRDDGGVNSRFLIHHSGHTAEALTEYGAGPAATGDGWTYATPDVTSGWVALQMTGFAKDDARGEADLINVMVKNAENAARALRDYINTTLLGTGSSCLQLWVDETSTVAGVNRTTYSAFGSAETAVSGVLTLDDMDDLVEEVTSGDRQAPQSELEWWAPANQITNYRRLAGETGALAHTPERVNPGGHLDLGYTSYSHNGIPIRRIPDLTTTVWLLVHRPSLYILEKRPLTVEPKPYASDGELYYMSWRGALTCANPQFCGKLTGVTA